MNIAHNRSIGLGTVLALALAFIAPVFAGPGPQAWRTAKPITSTKEAETVKPDSTVMLVCGACKTVMLTEFKSPQANGRATPRWMEVGTKHNCDHCGGSITVVNGKTKDSMQHNCSMCGEGAAFCCAVTPAEDKK